MLSDRGLPDFPRLYRSVRCCLLLVQKHRPVPTFNYFPAQSLHFRYGSAAPYPTLRADVTTLLPRTRYGRLATPYPTGLPCCVLPAYKDCSRSQWKTAYAVFSVRTMLILYNMTSEMSSQNSEFSAFTAFFSTIASSCFRESRSQACPLLWLCNFPVSQALGRFLSRLPLYTRNILPLDFL